MGSFGGYYLRFAKRFAVAFYHSGRSYVFSSVTIAIVVFLLGKHEDASNWTAFTLTLKACVTVLVFFAIFHLVRTPWKIHQEVQSILSSELSQTKAALAGFASQQKPVAQSRFSFEDNCACIYVKNAGVIAEFFAPLRLENYFRVGDVHARWAHTNDVRTRIPAGVERKLLIAELKYIYGPMSTSQWEIFYNRDGGGIGSTRPTYSSIVGHADGQAPDVRLEVVIASDPDMVGGIQSRRIILHSNRAEEAE